MKKIPADPDEKCFSTPWLKTTSREQGSGGKPLANLLQIWLTFHNQTLPEIFSADPDEIFFIKP
jgi:hypothetical protein